MQKEREVTAFRLDRDVIRMIELSSKQRKISRNALVEGILDHSLRAEVLERALDPVSIGRETLVSILETIDSRRLEDAGHQCGKKNFALARELFGSNGINLDFFRFLTEILGEQARWFRAEGTLIKPERITLQHRLGPKWSGFLRTYLSSAYEITSQDKLTVAVGSDFVSVRFPGVFSQE
ncbi:MAG TPA: hypothetical protein VGR53_03365 [Nitrososphaerales archaeon]|nr:hypothetical protein [Nitrososphaerales archaeon]